MMWPFDGDRGGVLALYVVTLALHAVFASYVVAGSAYALARRDAIAHDVRTRLPFMLGCGITAGVAPLLFVQLLHQRRFYTAHLLLGPRALAIVPALIVGFYALYLAKASEKWHRAALGTALSCFAFVAWSWSELHEIMQADPEWSAFYAAGDRFYTDAQLAPRLVVLAGAMATIFAAVAAWFASDRRPLAVVALAGRVVSFAGAAWLWRAGFAVDGPARGWLWLLGGAAVVDSIAWLAVAWRDHSGALIAATSAGAAALLAAVVVREAPRVALIEPSHGPSGGAAAFAIALVVGALAIAWVIRAVAPSRPR
jgi:drug/metabolite transporter (DMT)-like permease